MPFKRLDGYEVLAPIAEGGMATVWLARSVATSDLVALKVIKPEFARDKGFIAMFVDEARIASRLAHPNIIATRELGHDGKRHYLVMEVLRGHALYALWNRAHTTGRRLERPLVAWIGARIADALEYAHELRDAQGAEQHVVHRDVSPSNVFVTRDGVPKLIDFGLAKARDRLSSTAFGVVKGKLAYLAPEQYDGHPADRRSDVFALGVTLWEVLVDRRLFREETDAETIRRVRESDVPDPASIDPQIPPDVAAAVLRALARDPKKRFQTAAELRDALDLAASAAGTVGPDRLKATMAEIFAGEDPPAWERLADEAALGPERIRVWDDERQKLTWMHAAIDPIDDGQEDATIETRAVTPEAAPTRREALLAATAERSAAIDAGKDPVGAARVHLERAIVEELLGDPARAAEHAARSVAIQSTAAAHALLRRTRHARTAAEALIESVDAERLDAIPESARADLLCERARLVAAAGKGRKAVREAWERALAAAPSSPAALRGLEAVLAGDPKAGVDRAAHLATLAAAWTAEPRLAAWLHVERARILDAPPGRTSRAAGAPPSETQVDAAKASLERGLELDGGVGPVRAACVDHAVVHRDTAWHVDLLAGEAALERDPARAARLELDAALHARHRLGDLARAVTLLERAAARVPIDPFVHKRVLSELLALHERAGRQSEALRVRRLRLPRIDDPRARAQEHRRLARLEQAAGNHVPAVVAFERALELTPDDATIADELDVLLDKAHLLDRRVELFTRRAAAVEGERRCRWLLRAARLAELQQQRTHAVELARAALVAHPASVDATDLLLRLAWPPSDAARAEARERIAIHAHAAEHAPDVGRRVAHLEAIALLQEEALGDANLAVATFERVLRLDPGRRTAIVGMARAASRAGDALSLSRALLDEANLTSDPAMADALRVRAAEALPPLEAERALAIVGEVLARVPGHADARWLERRLYEMRENWAGVDASLAAAIEHATDAPSRVDLWLARADVQRGRLGAPRDALASLRAALAIDPAHPGARETLVDELETLGDPTGLRDGLIELAATAPSPGEKVDLLLRAADIDEHTLLDDAHAATLVARALEESPGDEDARTRRLRLAQRTARATTRGGVAAEWLRALQADAERSPASPQRVLDLALATIDSGGAAAEVLPLAERLLEGDPKAPHALRLLERVGRIAESAPLLANAFAQQADAFSADAVVLGALWAELDLVEWTLPQGDAASIVDRILRLAPNDRVALDTAIRLAMASLRAGGEPAARSRVVAAVRARIAAGGTPVEELWGHLAIGLALEPEAAPAEDRDAARGALAAYRQALRIDARSVVAATGAARLAPIVDDAEASVAASLALADLASDAHRRATLLVHAAGQTLNARDPRLGERPERLARAAEMLERALDADPEALPAVGLLVAVRTEDHSDRDVLLAPLRLAFDRASSPDVVAELGAEVARVASIAPPERLLAIEALRRVLTLRPAHTATLRALADHYVAQQAWGEAIDTLARLAAAARDSRAKLGAFFEMADVYAHRLARPADAERALRAALDADPASVDALRRLLAFRRSQGAASDETLPLLVRLADAETVPEARASALSELASLHGSAGDKPAAERALVEATSLAPTPARIAALMELHAGATVDQVRSLEAVVARAQESDRADALCLATLGRLEVDVLGRWPEGIAHLRLAVALAPTMHEARAALAKGLSRMRGSEEAAATVLAMIAHDSAPLLSLGDPGDALATLERALSEEGRADEAMVARELRALAGGLDDGSHSALRARRFPTDAGAPVPGALDAATLRASVAPGDAPALLFDIAASLGGVETKIARVELEELGASSRARLSSNAPGHPLLVVVQRLAAAFSIDRPDVVIGVEVRVPRFVGSDPGWLVVPESVASLSEPVQAALLAPAFARAALGATWTEDLRSLDAHAVLCAAARQVVPDFAVGEGGGEVQDRVDEMVRRVGKAIGRKQKRALQAIAPALEALGTATLADARAFELALTRTGLRAAFVATGDWLATLDAARASDAELARGTASVGRSALTAALAHPAMGDVARYALASSTTSLRWRARTLWGPP